MKNILIIGAGYVGYSLGYVLSKRNNISFVDNDDLKIKKIKNGIPAVEDRYFIENDNQDLHFSVFKNLDEALNKNKSFDYFIMALPTNFDEVTSKFNTKALDEAIEKVLLQTSEGVVVIKSTVPIGYTNHINESYSTNRVIFSPEFLREGNAIYDNLFPSRIISGGHHTFSNGFAGLLKNSSQRKDVNILLTESKEAEAIKLFSNTYLAMRVAFFNELDTFALYKNLNSKDIIEGISMDDRIGSKHKNPSFGYGGYCLPKDSKQLKSNFDSIPQDLMSAIIKSNETRKRYIADYIADKSMTIGIYRLSMKKGSDNFRESPVIDIIKLIDKKVKNIIIFEPNLIENNFMGHKKITNLSVFKQNSDLILANRNADELDDVKNKVFTRDIYGIN